VKAEERLRLEFNDWAKAGRGERMEQGHRPTAEQAIAGMKIEPTSTVLDLGCGSCWATRLMADRAVHGRVVGIDISDEMIALARSTSTQYPQVEFQIASAENLPFAPGEFTHAFSMESIYYYSDMLAALKEVRRVLATGGLFAAVVDLFRENEPTHQWVEQLNVPVHLLGISEYRALFEQAGFTEIADQRLYDPTPVPDDYAGGSFKTREDYLQYRAGGSLLISGRASE
jgi:ubiquinone/menaquinone biosynthesis C-methylase UbiE